MKLRLLAAASAVAFVLGASVSYAADEKPAKKSPIAQRAKNLSELYMETLPGTLPGGVPVGPQPANPMGGGSDQPAPAPETPAPTPAQPTPAQPGPSPEPQPDPTPVGEAPPPPAPPAPPAPPSYGGCPT